MEKYNAQLKAYNILLNDPLSPEELIRNTLLRINTTNKNIEHLKPKLK